MSYDQADIAVKRKLKENEALRKSLHPTRRTTSTKRIWKDMQKEKTPSFSELIEAASDYEELGEISLMVTSSAAQNKTKKRLLDKIEAKQKELQNDPATQSDTV